jgi:hypothetical protein
MADRIGVFTLGGSGGLPVPGGFRGSMIRLAVRATLLDLEG